MAIKNYLVVLRSGEKVTVWIATTEGVSTVYSLIKRTLLIGILEELRLAAELARGAISFRACDGEGAEHHIAHCHPRHPLGSTATEDRRA